MALLDDENLIQEFTTDSLEQLTAIEPDLLAMESLGEKAGQETINRIFRAIHNIKGTSGFFGFTAIIQLSHIMENVLMMLRDHKISPTPEVIEALLSGGDKLRYLLENIRLSDEISDQSEIQKLEKLLQDKKSSPSPPTDRTLPREQTAVEPPVKLQHNAKDIHQALAHGHHFYELNLSLVQDFLHQEKKLLTFFEQLAAVGKIQETTLDIEKLPDLADCFSEDVEIQILYSSILEPDLMFTALEIEPNKLKQIDKEEIAEKYLSSNQETSSLPSQQEPEALPQITENKDLASPQSTGSAIKESTETIRVKVSLLNQLMDLAGEMVLSRNQLLSRLGTDIPKSNKNLSLLQNINFMTSSLQEQILQTRMQPLGIIFGKFPRIIRDLSKQLGKEIDLQVHGEDVELDKSILENLTDPLTHILRNCCDHAIEHPEERSKIGKPPHGTIYIRAFYEGGQITISISDDGRGINPVKVRNKAVEKGLIREEEAENLTEQDCIHFIFMPGFSTAETISDISGRGVGMDVVKTNIEKLGGRISIDTTLGEGTTFLLHLPLTLAIIPALIVSICDQRFAVPQANLVELVRVKAEETSTRIENIGKVPVLRLREKLLPLVHAADVLGIEKTYCDKNTGRLLKDRRSAISDLRSNLETTTISSTLKQEEPTNRRTHSQSDYTILVLKVGLHQFGLIVDDVFDIEEIVIKPMSSYLKECQCFSGATILGNGQVALILNISGIINTSSLSFTDIDLEKRQLELKEARSIEPKQKQQALLLFTNALHEIFALPLSSLLRLEKFKVSEINQIGDKEFLVYQGKGLPIVRLETLLPVASPPQDLEEGYLIIPKTDTALAGIFASNILDTVETELNLEKPLVGKLDLSHSTLIHEKITTVIDPFQLLKAAGIRPEEGTVE